MNEWVLSFYIYETANSSKIIFKGITEAENKRSAKNKTISRIKELMVNHHIKVNTVVFCEFFMVHKNVSSDCDCHNLLWDGKNLIYGNKIYKLGRLNCR